MVGERAWCDGIAAGRAAAIIEFGDNFVWSTEDGAETTVEAASAVGAVDRAASASVRDQWGM